MGFWQFSMYAYINCQNKSFMGITTGVVQELRRLETDAGISRVGEAGMGLLEAGMTLRLSIGRAEIFA